MEEACGPCPLGSYCQGGAAFSCVAGTYGDKEGMTSITDCKDCGLNKWSSTIGAKSSTDCQECGTDAAGNELTTKTTTAASVKECELLTFSCPSEDRARRPVESSIDQCEDCPAGTHGDQGLGVQCTLCSLNHYQDEMGQQECKECTTDFCAAVAGATSQAEGVQLMEEYSFVTDISSSSIAAVNATDLDGRETKIGKEEFLNFDTGTKTILYLSLAIPPQALSCCIAICRSALKVLTCFLLAVT